MLVREPEAMSGLVASCDSPSRDSMQRSSSTSTRGRWGTMVRARRRGGRTILLKCERTAKPAGVWNDIANPSCVGVSGVDREIVQEIPQYATDLLLDNQVETPGLSDLEQIVEGAPAGQRDRRLGQTAAGEIEQSVELPGRRTGTGGAEGLDGPRHQ